MEKNKKELPTRFGEYCGKKSINKASVSRKTGISKARLTELSLRQTTRLTAEELYRIAVAIGMEPGVMLEELYGPLRKEVEDRATGFQ